MLIIHRHGRLTVNALPSHLVEMGNLEIYVMSAKGGNQRRLTEHGSHDSAPAWFTSALAVAPVGKTLRMWGWLKQAGPMKNNT